MHLLSEETMGAIVSMTHNLCNFTAEVLVWCLCCRAFYMRFCSKACCGLLMNLLYEIAHAGDKNKKYPSCCEPRQQTNESAQGPVQQRQWESSTVVLNTST